MNESINYSTFLQIRNKKNHKPRRENSLFSKINVIETVVTNKNPMTHLNKSQSSDRT